MPITYGEISAFERLADDAKLAEELPDKLALAKMATVQFAHVEPLLERISTLGADPMEAMAPFVKPFDVFHAADGAERLARGPDQGVRR